MIEKETAAFVPMSASVATTEPTTEPAAAVSLIVQIDEL